MGGGWINREPRPVHSRCKMALGQHGALSGGRRLSEAVQFPCIRGLRRTHSLPPWLRQECTSRPTAINEPAAEDNSGKIMVMTR